MAIITDKLYFVSKCVLLNSEKKFLILKRTDYKKDGTGDLWDIPGGSVDQDEEVNSAVKREVLEELQLTLNNPKVFAVDSGKGTPSGYYIFTIFHCLDYSGELTLSEEHSEYKWISIDEIDNYDYYLTEERIESIREFLKEL
jgi:8-oxo-dGTP diphosphatase